MITLGKKQYTTLDLILAVNKGAKYSINLEKRTCRINGKLVDFRDYEEKEPLTTKDVLETIEFLYKMYKHSVPSERSESKRKTYFRALPESELSNEDMMYGSRREFDRFNLEFFVLCSIINGELKWQEEWGSWFWQSKKDKDLVILREWVEPKSNNKQIK